MWHKIFLFHSFNDEPWEMETVEMENFGIGMPRLWHILWCEFLPFLLGAQQSCTSGTRHSKQKSFEKIETEALTHSSLQREFPPFSWAWLCLAAVEKKRMNERQGLICRCPHIWLIMRCNWEECWIVLGSSYLASPTFGELEVRLEPGCR